MAEGQRQDLRTYASLQTPHGLYELVHEDNGLYRWVCSGGKTDLARASVADAIEAAKGVDWRAFAGECYEVLRATGRTYMVKESLAPYLPRSADRRRTAA